MVTALERTCPSCQARFLTTVAEQEWYAEQAAINPARDWRLPKHCLDCRSARRAADLREHAHAGDEQRLCRDCGAPYTFTARGREYFKSRGWPPPHRCRDCRAARNYARGR
jgi:hypothetical protein